MCPFIYQLTYMGCQLIDRQDEKNDKNESSSDSPETSSIMGSMTT